MEIVEGLYLSAVTIALALYVGLLFESKKKGGQ